MHVFYASYLHSPEYLCTAGSSRWLEAVCDQGTVEMLPPAHGPLSLSGLVRRGGGKAKAAEGMWRARGGKRRPWSVSPTRGGSCARI